MPRRSVWTCFSLSGKFVVSGGEDCTIKMWDVGDAKYNLHCRATERAHDKDINSIAVSPNDKYIVTASQDKTAKVFYISKHGTSLHSYVAS